MMGGMKAFIGWIGTIVVAFVFAAVLVTIATPLVALIERVTGIDILGTSLPKDWIYLLSWVILIFVLHWFVFRRKRRKKRGF